LRRQAQILDEKPRFKRLLAKTFSQQALKNPLKPVIFFKSTVGNRQFFAFGPSAQNP
jgi:hypothetical protein